MDKETDSIDRWMVRLRNTTVRVIAISIFLVLPYNLQAQTLFYYSPGNFSFNLSDGWKRVPNDVVNTYMDKLMAQMKGAIKRPKYDVVFAYKTPYIVFERPYVTIQVKKIGYFNKNEIEIIIQSMQNKSQEVLHEEGIKDMVTDALISTISYDPAKHMLTHSVEIKMKTLDGKDHYLTAVDSIIFCKYGLVQVCFYCPTKIASSFLPDFKAILESFVFDEGYEY
jgi:hypothetical protein